jgi:putative ABC transport system permease protein
MRTGSDAGRAFGNGLVVAEIAVAFALLVGAGLLVKNLVRLQERDAGIQADHVVTFDLSPAGQRYRAPEQVQAFYRELYQRLTQVDGVESIGLISHLPMYRFGSNGEMSREGGDLWGPNNAPLVEYRWMYGNYLKALGVPLVKGRLLDERDRTGTASVLINQAMAKKFWPGEDPLGKRFGQGQDRSRWYQVVGVVGDIRSFGLAGNSPYEFYRTIDQQSFENMTVVLRSRRGDPRSLIPIARQIVGSIDASMPIAGVQTMEEVVAASVGQPRLMSALTMTFGALAGLLAMVGVYGVMAYNVRRQRREFGIRLALGANSARVRNLVVQRGLVLAIIGVAIGVLIARLLTGTLKVMLNDVTATDPAVFGGTAVAVLIVAVLASYLPARAAGRVDPIIVLRDG